MVNNHSGETPAAAGEDRLTAESSADEFSVEFLMEEVSIGGMCSVY